MRNEDYDYDHRDDLQGHHAAGAAEAAWENAMDDEDEDDVDPKWEMELESRPWHCPFD